MGCPGLSRQVRIFTFPLGSYWLLRPIFTIAAGGTQIVRMGLRRQPDDRRELAYRLFLQEVPIKTTREGEVNVVLRLGIPIFVMPSGNPPKPQLTWRIVEIPQKGLHIEATNHGDAHVQVSSFSIRGAEGESILSDHHEMGYLLPGQGRHWLVALDQVYPPETKMKIIARTDSGDINAEVILER